MKFKRIVRRSVPTLVTVALVIGAYLWLTRLAPTPGVFDESVTIQQASQRAENDGRVVLALVTADFCSTCQGYKRGALSDERFAEWVRDNAEPVYLEWERDEDQIRSMGVGAFPATVVLDGRGDVLALRYGSMSTDQLLAFLDMATHQAPEASEASDASATVAADGAS